MQKSKFVLAGLLCAASLLAFAKPAGKEKFVSPRTILKLWHQRSGHTL